MKDLDSTPDIASHLCDCGTARVHQALAALSEDARLASLNPQHSTLDSRYNTLGFVDWNLSPAHPASNPQTGASH